MCGQSLQGFQTDFEFFEIFGKFRLSNSVTKFFTVAEEKRFKFVHHQVSRETIFIEVFLYFRLDIFRYVILYNLGFHCEWTT